MEGEGQRGSGRVGERESTSGSLRSRAALKCFGLSGSRITYTRLDIAKLPKPLFNYRPPGRGTDKTPMGSLYHFVGKCHVKVNFK